MNRRRVHTECAPIDPAKLAFFSVYNCINKKGELTKRQSGSMMLVHYFTVVYLHTHRLHTLFTVHSKYYANITITRARTNAQQTLIYVFSVSTPLVRVTQFEKHGSRQSDIINQAQP